MLAEYRRRRRGAGGGPGEDDRPIFIMDTSDIAENEDWADDGDTGLSLSILNAIKSFGVKAGAERVAMRE